MGARERPLLFVIAFSVGACALQTPLSPEAASGMKGRRLTTLVRRAPSFYAPPPEGVSPFTGALSLMIAKTVAGERIIRDNGITDPTLSVARQVADVLATRYGLQTSPPVVTAVIDDDPTAIGAAAPSADLVLDVWTDSWGVKAIEIGEESKYRATYQVELRIIDAKAVRPIDGKAGVVLAEASCSDPGEDAPNAPNYAQFLDDGARLLKKDLDAATQFCVADFRTRILKAK